MAMMNQSEIDSFVSKFSNLCHAGGNASVNLSVELGRLPDVEEHPHTSRQRRREKRAKIQKVKAAQDLSPE